MNYAIPTDDDEEAARSFFVDDLHLIGTNARRVLESIPQHDREIMFAHFAANYVEEARSMPGFELSDIALRGYLGCMATDFEMSRRIVIGIIDWALGGPHSIH